MGSSLPLSVHLLYSQNSQVAKKYKGIMSRDGLEGEMDVVSPMKRKGEISIHSLSKLF